MRVEFLTALSRVSRNSKESGREGRKKKYLVRLVSRQRKLQVQSETVSLSGLRRANHPSRYSKPFFTSPPSRKRNANMEIYFLHRLLEEFCGLIRGTFS